MIVQCPACNARYRIRDSNIPPSGGKIRCPSCGHSFIVYPEAKAPVAEDRTSITSKGALNDLVSTMASRPQADDGDATEMVSASDLDQIRQLQSGMDDMPEDGTVEIKNPMEFWERLQAEKAAENQSEGGIRVLSPPTGLDIGATIQDGVAVTAADEEEYDDSPTAIVGGDVASLAAFAKPSIPGLTPPSSSGLPTPGFPGSPVPSLPKPALPPLHAPTVPQPQMPPTIPHPQTIPTPHAAPTIPQPQVPQFPQTPAPVAPNTDAMRPDSSPGLLAPQVPSYAPDPFGMASPQDGLGATPSTSTDDILAAIEEVSQAHFDEPSLPMVPGDPNHEGPWKLKTNFGLTYEFPDTKSLTGWLSSRDELDGYSVSTDGADFLEIDAFPQLARGAAPAQMMASSGLYRQPDSLPQSPDVAPFSSPQQMPSAGFSSASGSFPDMAAPAEPVRVNNEFRPPSSEAKMNKLLWVVFLFLVIAGGLLAVHTFGVYDLVGLITGVPSETKINAKPPAPILTDDPVVAVQEPDAGQPSDELDELIKKARRNIRQKKLPSALETLDRIAMVAPERLEIWELKLEVYNGLGQTEDAEIAQNKIDAIMATAAAADAGSADAGTTPDGGMVDSN